MVLYTFYRIVCKDLSVKYCYVGSTQNFTRRKYQHKSDCETCDYKVYQVIRENGGWSNWTMVKIEDSEHETKLDARKRERELLKQFGNGMNSEVPGRIPQEYYQENRERRLEYHKQYVQENRERILEHQKQYYQENKEQIADRAKQKYKCECGGRYTHTHKSRHIKSEKHQNFLNHTTS